ncbi:hypothetical protein HGM15179_009760 [Zosterops borbonicus]|uniref:Uncharacterized protein n=1 Tax=Zosterops borbonicus TaxID=364589 RepID=A0A8K1LKB7_9PASS|nr:hypothetical protein HGM15179_009760 [Zosterops borbonicus]
MEAAPRKLTENRGSQHVKAEQTSGKQSENKRKTTSKSPTSPLRIFENEEKLVNATIHDLERQNSMESTGRKSSALKAKSETTSVGRAQQRVAGAGVTPEVAHDSP